MPVSLLKQPATSLQRDLLYNLQVWPVRLLQASLLPVPVKCCCCSLQDQSARLLPVKASLLLVPVRCQVCSLLDLSASLLPVIAILLLVSVRCLCCSLHSKRKKTLPSRKFLTGQMKQRNSIVILPQLLDSGCLLDDWLSQPIALETLRRWQRSARDSTLMCNQAAGFSGCLTRVHNSMVTQDYSGR